MREYWRSSRVCATVFENDLIEIKDEVYAFLKWQVNDPLPDGKGGLLTFKYLPVALYWKRWVDKYGLPLDGGWVDQPLMFMREIDAAQRAVAQFEAEQTDPQLILLKQIRDALRRK